MSNELKIFFWGVRGSTPCANVHNMVFGGNTTCIQFELEGFKDLIIADCGTGVRNLGNDLADIKAAKQGRIFVTHPHWDHLQGFPFFKPFYNSKNYFQVYMPPQGDVSCKEILQGHLSNTFFPVSIDMLEADVECLTFEEGVLNFDNYSVEYMFARHTAPTAMYKFTFGERKIVFAPDNELPFVKNASNQLFLEKFQNFVAGVDVLVHDGQFNKEQHQSRIGWGHSDWETVLETVKDLQIKKLFLTHHDPDSCDEMLSKRDKEIQCKYGKCFEQVCLIKEGQEIILP